MIELVFIIASTSRYTACVLKHAILVSAMDVDCRQVVESPAPIVFLNVTTCVYEGGAAAPVVN